MSPEPGRSFTSSFATQPVSAVLLVSSTPHVKRTWFATLTSDVPGNEPLRCRRRARWYAGGDGRAVSAWDWWGVFFQRLRSCDQSLQVARCALRFCRRRRPGKFSSA